jgi:hypothetical protein
MQRLKNFAVSILILALVALPSTTSSQNERSFDRPSRPDAPQDSRPKQGKFRKVSNAILNRYIVVLNDDVADNTKPRKARLERVTDIANSHALAHFGRVDHHYDTALKGYSIETTEAAAVAIIMRPVVLWV